MLVTTVITIATILIVWVTVILNIKYRGRPDSTLYTDQLTQTLHFGKTIVKAQDILTIKIQEQHALHYSYNYLLFEYFEAGRPKTIKIANIPRPFLADVFKDQLLSLQRLLAEIPALKHRVTQTAGNSACAASPDENSLP
ncbi:MAG: hypothetical protein V4635_03115 [Bacteroidota bacterium]